MAKKDYELVLAEEKAVAQVQAMALRLMDARQISRSQLAECMGVSAAHVSQLLGDEPKNLSLKKAVRLFYALGERLSVSCEGIERLNREAREKNAYRAVMMQRPSLGFNWRCANLNDSGQERECSLVAA